MNFKADVISKNFRNFQNIEFNHKVHKVHMLVISDPFPIHPPSLYVQIRFPSTPLPPITIIKILFYKEDMTEMYFVNYYQSKNHKHCHNKKKLLYRAIVALFSILSYAESLSAGQKGN